MPLDQLVQEIRCLPPLQGVQEGLDPALPDALYRPTFYADLRNVRAAGGKIETRLGMSLWKSIGGSGDVRLLADMYTSTGQRIRLAARGSAAAASLYNLLEGTDVAFVATTGGTGLGGSAEPYFLGVVLNDAFYFTDRAGALRKYQRAPSAGNQVRSVLLPTKPSAAPGVKAKTYEVLDSFSNPATWTASSGDIELVDATATFPPPSGAYSVWLHNNNASAPGDYVAENVSGEAIPSATIAFWLRRENTNHYHTFQYGQVAPTDYSHALQLNFSNQWQPMFVQVDLATINYKRFFCVAADDGDSAYLTALVLPGYLQGSYKWVYTHYDPALKRESEPSAISNGGVPLDLSALGTAAAFQKSAALTFTSDSGTDATTTKIRVYRNGGVPALTRDNRGVDVWLRVGEIFDQSTTLSGAHSAGATSVVVASATNLAVGDWLVIEKGTVSKEEYVHITAIVTTTLTISQPLQYAHSSGAAVQLTFVDNIPNEQVDVTARIELDRDDPPAGTKWIARSPDGRIWLANYSGKPTGIAVSNRATPDRPTDYEVFPQGIDPVTRRHPLQGWDFEIGGDSTDEEITWFGFYNDRPYAFTRRHFYAINALSQLDWGPDAVVKVHNVGCVAGDTVKALDGMLYWVADGGRVMRWNGPGTPPENLSHQRVDVRLQAAPKDTWKSWFGAAHARLRGNYYSLYYAPEAGEAATTDLVNTLAANLAGYWKLDEASGTRVDSAGDSDLTDNNTVTQAAGKVANAGQFTVANTEYLNTGDNTALSMGVGVSFSIAAWVYLDSKGAFRTIVHKGGTTTADAAYNLFFDNTNDRFSFQIDDPSSSTATVLANTLGVPALATWYFVVGWFDSSTNSVNIQVNDGGIDTASAGGFSARDDSLGFGIGGRPTDGSLPWDGRIDEVGVWKKVLTAAEKTALYNSGNGLSYPYGGATSVSAILDYAIEQGAWEPRQHRNSGGAPITWRALSVRDGGSDVSELYQVDSGGSIYQAETGDDDQGVDIPLLAMTKRYDLGAVSMLQSLYLRLEAVSDSLTVRVIAGGSEYGQVEQSYVVSVIGSNDLEARIRLHRILIGRWAQVELSGDVDARPAVREMTLRYVPIRSGRLTI